MIVTIYNYKYFFFSNLRFNFQSILDLLSYAIKIIKFPLIKKVVKTIIIILRFVTFDTFFL